MSRVFLVSVLFSACAPPSPNPGASASIGADGGTLTTQSGVTIIVPPGALPGEKAIGAELVAAPKATWTALPVDVGTVGGAVVLTPHGTEFDEPVLVRIPVSVEGAETVLLRMNDEKASEWEVDGPVAVKDGFAEFSVTHFSVYLVATVAKGACPCWSGEYLEKWYKEHLARPGNQSYGYGSQTTNGVTSTGSGLWMPNGMSEYLGVQRSSAVGFCGRQTFAAAPLFTAVGPTQISPNQALVCEMLLTGKVRLSYRGVVQIAATTTTAPVTIAVTAAGKTTSLALSDNKSVVWLYDVFRSGTPYSASITSGPQGYDCVISPATGTLGSSNLLLEVSCTAPDDSDSDGTPDAEDDCPQDPFKIAAGQCGCGNEETNTDGDAAADCIDECDTDPNKVGAGVCGCGAAETNTDGDSAPDCTDACDTDPNKTTVGLCGCGVADAGDMDNDGTLDCVDACDDDPNKTVAGVCGCGIADTNTDGDAQLDCQETCDTDPNKTAPGVCGCGIPDQSPCFPVTTIAGAADWDPSWNTGTQGNRWSMSCAGAVDNPGNFAALYSTGTSVYAAVVGASGLVHGPVLVDGYAADSRFGVFASLLQDGTRRVLATFGYPDAQLRYTLITATSNPITVVGPTGSSGVVTANARVFRGAGLSAGPGVPLHGLVGFAYTTTSAPETLSVKLIRANNPARSAVDSFTRVEPTPVSIAGVGSNSVAVAWGDRGSTGPTGHLEMTIGTYTPTAVDTDPIAVSYLPVFEVRQFSGLVTDVDVTNLTLFGANIALAYVDGSTGNGYWRAVDATGATVVAEQQFGEQVTHVRMTTLNGGGVALVFTGQPVGGGSAGLYALRTDGSGVVVAGPSIIGGHFPSSISYGDVFTVVRSPTNGRFSIGTSQHLVGDPLIDNFVRISTHQ